MEVKLYINRSKDNYLDKSLTLVATKEISAYDIVSVDSPRLTLSDNSISDLSQVNYCYIPSLGRYYYARVILASDGIYQIECKSDALMSFKNRIRQLSAVVDKTNNENYKNPFIADGTYVTQANAFLSTYQFDVPSSQGGFTDDPVNILICAGGVANAQT